MVSNDLWHLPKSVFRKFRRTGSKFIDISLEQKLPTLLHTEEVWNM